MELDQVKATERRRVLVLLATLDPHLEPLDAVGEIGDLVVVDGQAQELDDRGDQGDRNRRGRPEA